MGDMQIDYKAVPAYGVKVVDDEAGVVEAVVSVTGNVDDGGDKIMPGAYAKTLRERTPKGVHGHSWQTPVAKALEVEELLPGDERLKQVLDNDTWLEFSQNNWGGLYVKSQYNLDTQRGRETYSDVKFYGPEQEWSIGYSTGPGDTKKAKDGTREIHNLTLYEWSDVLFGMNPRTVTAAVKQLQRKAFVVVSDSYEDVRRRVQEAARDWAPGQFGADAMAYVEATFDDRVVLQVGYEAGRESWVTAYYQVPYTLSEDGVSFGDAVEVAIEGVVAPKTLEEAKARNVVLAQRTFALDPDDLVPAEKAELPERTVPNTPETRPLPDTSAPDAGAGTETVQDPAVSVEQVPNTPATVAVEDAEKGQRLDPLLVEWEMLELTG